MANTALSKENIWLNKSTYDKAEQLHFERLAKARGGSNARSTKLKSKKQSEEKRLAIDDKDNNTKKLTSDTQVLKSKAKECKEIKNKDKRLNNQSTNKENQHLPPSAPPTTTSTATTTTTAGGKLANEVAKARQHIKKSLQCMNGIEVLVETSTGDVGSRLANLEQEHHDLKNAVKELKDLINKLEIHVREVEGICKSAPQPFIAICPAKPTKPASKKDEGEDDIDLFASDSEGEDTEASKLREERLAEYNAKKSKKPVLIAKSNIILDVKPWDDETDLIEMEEEVRKISCDGLLWGAAKHVPLAYGIHKLQISCVVEDDKVSVDWLTETIQNIEVYVQSVDIAAFNKV